VTTENAPKVQRVPSTMAAVEKLGMV